MGIFDKVKGLFVEEYEEEPIKKEVIQVEIPAPEVKREPVISDTTIVNNEEKVVPIFFTDEDFKDLEQPKKEIKSSYLKEKPIVHEKIIKQEPKKIFKPTPIISPVYGVLDKNYYKEDITSKNKSHQFTNNTNVTIDDIRKKAFGTLEDDLENTLFGINKFDETEAIDLTQSIELEDDLFDELEDEVMDIEEDMSSAEEVINMVEEMLEEPRHASEEISSGELFDLIDSMYEKGAE